MCSSAGFQVPASHQLRSCMHGLFNDRLVFPCGTIKCRHAWRWAGGRRNYLSFMKNQKFRKTDVWFQFWADAQVKSYFVQTTSPTLRHDIFRVKGQAKPREIPEHGLFAAGCTWNSSATKQDSLFSCGYGENLDLWTHTEACTRMFAHTPEQTSSSLSAGEASVTVSEARDFI